MGPPVFAKFVTTFTILLLHAQKIYQQPLQIKPYCSSSKLSAGGWIHCSKLQQWKTEQPQLNAEKKVSKWSS